MLVFYPILTLILSSFLMSDMRNISVNSVEISTVLEQTKKNITKIKLLGF
jgi:hypothetical protein